MKLTAREVFWLIIFLAFLYYIYRNLQLTSLVSRTGNRPVNCKRSAKEIQQLVDLAHEVHNVLDELGIKHWLMFGSLWGIQRKLYNPLPWDDDVDMGLSGDDIRYQSLSREKFLSAFTAKGFTLKEKLAHMVLWLYTTNRYVLSAGSISTSFMITVVLWSEKAGRHGSYLSTIIFTLPFPHAL